MNIRIFSALLVCLLVIIRRYGPVDSFSSHRLYSNNGWLELFCDTTRQPMDLQGSLAEKLLQLRETLNGAMTDAERFMTTYNLIYSEFSHRQTMVSLVRDVHSTFNALTCMGRALDIHINSRRLNDVLNYYDDGHEMPSHPRPPKLFRYGLLPDHVRHLRSDSSFRVTFNHALHDVHQMRSAMGDVNTSGSEGDHECQAWEHNSAMILVLSHGYLSVALSFMDGLSRACDRWP